MARAKPDLSRLVLLELTPSEAVLLRGFLRTSLRRIEPTEEGLILTRVLEEQCARLELQLRTLLWPLDAGKRAPVPL